MIEKLCKKCGKSFRVYPSLIRVIFCSRKCIIFSKERNKKISVARKGKPSNSKGKKWSTESIKNIINARNPNWKGSSVSYRGLHNWITKRLGKPEHCEHCQSVNEKMYDWANVSGLYKRDFKDWIRLCRKCHIKYDKKI